MLRCIENAVVADDALEARPAIGLDPVDHDSRHRTRPMRRRGRRRATGSLERRLESEF